MVQINQMDQKVFSSQSMVAEENIEDEQVEKEDSYFFP